MDALPRDVLVSILSSLPIEDVISVSQVSRWMLEASQDDRVWARREQWHSLPNLVAERAVGKWLGTVLGLPWQVIALNIKFDPLKALDEHDNPTSALRHLLPCQANLYIGKGPETSWYSHGMGSISGQVFTGVDLLHLRVLRAGAHENVLKDWKKDANAASDGSLYDAIEQGLHNVIREAGVPQRSEDLPDLSMCRANSFYEHDREEGYKGFGFDNVCVAGGDNKNGPALLIFDIKPRVLVAAALLTRMDATMFKDTSDGANSSPPPWSRKIEETRKESSGWTCWASQVLRPPNPKTEWSLLRARVVGVSLKAMHEAPMPPFDALSFDQIPWGPAVRLVTQTVQNWPNPSDIVDDPQTASAWPSLVLGPLPEADAERKRRRVTAFGDVSEDADGDESEKELRTSRMRGFTVGGCKYKPHRSGARLSVRGLFNMILHNYRRLFHHPEEVDPFHTWGRVFGLENLVFKGLISETQDFSSEAAASVSLAMASCGFRYEDTNIREVFAGGGILNSGYDTMFIFYELMERCNRSRAEGVDEVEEIVNKLQQDDEFIPIELWDERHALALAYDFPRYLQKARTDCEPFHLAECIEELASSWRTWQWRLDNSTLSPPSELADRIREILDRRTYEAMRLALTLLGILE